MKETKKLSGKLEELRYRFIELKKRVIKLSSRLSSLIKKKKEVKPERDYPELKKMADNMRFRQSKKDGIAVTELEKLFDDFKKQKTSVKHPFRLAVMGIGNDLKGDDGVGFHVVDELKKKIGKDPSVLLVKAGVPENHVREVKNFIPDLFLVIDSAEFRGKPGETRIIKEEEIQKIFFSSHTTPLTIFTKLLRNELPSVKIVIFGIQKLHTRFGLSLSRDVRKSGTRLASVISDLYKKKEIQNIEKEVEYSNIPFGLGKIKRFYDNA